jgi:hypothetical protein
MWDVALIEGPWRPSRSYAAVAVCGLAAYFQPISMRHLSLLSSRNTIKMQLVEAASAEAETDPSIHRGGGGGGFQRSNLYLAKFDGTRVRLYKNL